jgi:hypothetical protein
LSLSCSRSRLFTLLKNSFISKGSKFSFEGSKATGPDNCAFRSAPSKPLSGTKL